MKERLFDAAKIFSCFLFEVTALLAALLAAKMDGYH
jgi:hypothetical protein